MRALSILIMLLFLGSVSAAQIKYSTYENSRFGYSIDYPSNLLVMRPPPFNGDGRIFLSKDGDVEMRVWGQHNALFRSVQKEFEEALRSYGDGVSYKRSTKTGFTISGIRKERIFYQRTLYHKFASTDVFFTLTIEYPLQKRKVYDAIVEHVSRSFRVDPDADV